MPPKKKVEIDDSFSSSDDEVQKRTPKKKAVFRKPSPKKAAPKPTTSTMNGDKPGSDNEEGRFTGKQGYSGQYDHEGHGLLNVPIPQMAIPVMSADGTGARLMIKEIIVTNFKSYYGTQRIGPFHKNFSAIIGPNGSGKSNVIDSLLFVFGFRASRIRLKKLKELIHNSSGKKQPDSCTVEVVFHKIIDKVGGDYEVIEGSEFTVGRTAYQDSTSKYTINGRNRSKDEIEKKLKEVGIDLVHNRFLILQGEVEQIALMKPKAESAGKEGMLEYLEDIIGSSRLKNFLSDIGLKMDELSTEKSQQNQRVKAAEKDRDALEGPVREMISHLRCENQATLLNNKLLTIKKTSYERVLAENMPTVDKLKEKLNTAAERLDEVLTQKKEAEKEFAHLESDKDGLQKTLGKLQKHITELEAKESRRKIDYKKCAKDLSNGKDKLATYEKELADLLEVPGKADANIKMLVGEIEELREKVASDEAKIEKNTPLFEEKSAKLRDLKQSAEEELGEKQGVANEIQQKQRIAQEELNLMMAGQQKVQGRLEDLQRQLEEIQNKGKEAQKKHDAARARLPECEKALDEARAAVPDMQQERNNLMRECDGLKAKLQDETSAMKQQSQGSRVDRLLGEARDRGELKTYFGRLGDMGAIDSKYDAAVTTTTAGLNSYVLQTKEDGDKALAMIKAAKIGRHTLLVLDAVAEAREYMNADPRRFPAPRVFDLLQIPDKRMKKAFYNQFKDTMVVDSMEEARTIFNKHKGRYITLQGGVIDASGIISGGGKSRTGGMGSSVKVDTKRQTAETQDRIEGYKEQLNRKTAKLTELEDKIKKCDQTIYALNTEFNELRNTVRIQGNEANQQQQRVAPLEKQIAFTKDEVTKHRVDEALVAEKKESVKELNAEHEAAKRELTEAQDVFKKASDNLDRVWRELCGRFRETADSHKVDIAARETQIADQEGKKKSFEREKAKAEARLKTAEANVSDKTKLQEALKEDERNIEAELREKCDEKKEIEGNISEVDAQIKEARKSNSQNDEEENKLSQAMERLKDDLKSAKEEVQSLELEIKRVQKEISSLKLHRIKDYGILPQKVRKVAEYDHHIDQETLEEERAHQKKIRKHHKSMEDSGDEVSDGDDGAVPVLTAEDVKDFDKEDLKFRLQQLQDKVRKNKDTVNMRIIGEYTEKVKKYNAESSVLQKLSELHSAHMKKQEEWKRVRLQEFMEGFSKIGSSLKEMYQMITLGGDAALDLKDSLDPFTEGISFMVRPPKKSWKNMENLSGGEKTLSSLSLVFALHHFRPTPLYVMDEIDAALDFRNVSIIGHYVKDRTKNAQFIIISLRNNMFELGDRLVGIYKTDDCTKNVVIDPAKVMEESLKFQKALKTVHQRDLDRTMQANEAVEEEDNSVLPHGVHGRKRVSEESSVTDNKRHDHRLSPASDPGRRHRLPLRPASQDTTNQGDL